MSTKYSKLILILLHYISVSNAQYCVAGDVCGCYKRSIGAWLDDCTCADFQKEDDCAPDGQFCGSTYSLDGTQTAGDSCTDQCDGFNMDTYVPNDDGTIDYATFQVTLCRSILEDSGLDPATYINTNIVPDYDAEAAQLN